MAEECTNAPNMPPADSGLRCPKCDYNLTGVAENRCPECGEAFDPEELRSFLAGGPAHIPIWDDPKQPLALRFAKICLLTWFLPARVGRMFPRRYSKDSAASFRRTVLWVSTFLPTTAVFLTGDVELIATSLFALLLYVVAVLSCEIILSRLLCTPVAILAVARPPKDNAAPDSLKGLVGLFRSYMLLEAIGVWLIGLFSALNVTDLLSCALIWTLIVCVWWIIALASAVAARRDGMADVLAGLVIILLAVLLSLLVVCIVGVTVAMLFEMVVSTFS